MHLHYNVFPLPNLPFVLSLSKHEYTLRQAQGERILKLRQCVKLFYAFFITTGIFFRIFIRPKNNWLRCQYRIF